MYQGYIQPYATNFTTGMGATYPPGIAIVEPGNPIGGAFTLPTGFINVTGTYSLTPKTAWPGYTTVVYVDYYNGPGKFQPNFGSSASQVRMVFPTTGGNPVPNYGGGDPVTPTTTFDGRYDVSRGGSINITPGANRFGGTFRLFYGPNAGWKQYIYYFSQRPRSALYQGYRYYLCFDDGMYDCTPNTFVSDPGTTAMYLGVWWLLTEKGRAKATTPTRPNGTVPTPYGNASYLKRSQHYLNLIHPWTTGFASAVSTRWWSSWISPQASGYDTSLGGVTLSVKKYRWNQNFNKTLSTLTTFTSTPYTQVLKGVTRVVSMVRPRLVHTYTVPIDPVGSIENTWQVARMWRLKVFFLPEPTGLLMLSTGLGLLVVLHRASRRG
jgi:hypothetical protein